MKVLLDEGVPRVLAGLLRDRGLDVAPFPNDWKGMTNGALLNAAQQAGFGVLVTNDKNVVHQRPAALREIALVVLPTNRRSVVIQTADGVAAAIRGIKMGETAIVPPEPSSSPEVGQRDRPPD